MEDAVVEPPPRTLPLVPTATTTTTTATTAVLANNNNKRIARTQNMSSPRPPSTPFLPLSNTDLQPCSLCGGVAHLYGNSLVVCRKCKTCFHQLCHYPKILEEALSYEPVRWVCASCTEKTKSAVPELLLKSQVFVRRHNEVASIAAKLAIASGTNDTYEFNGRKIITRIRTRSATSKDAACVQVYAKLRRTNGGCL